MSYLKKSFLFLIVLLISLSSCIFALEPGEENYKCDFKYNSTIMLNQTISYYDFFTMVGATPTSVTMAYTPSSNNDILEFNNSAQTLTAKKPGKCSCQITVNMTMDNTGRKTFQMGSIEMTVIDTFVKPEMSINFKDLILDLGNNRTYQLNPIFNPSLPTLSWKVTNSSVSGNIANVSPEGVITAQSVGTGVMNIDIEYQVAGQTFNKSISFNLNVINSGQSAVVPIDNNKIKDLYNKYLSQYNQNPENLLNNMPQNDLLNENFNITDFGRKASLDYVNFYREISGAYPITGWNNEYINYSQAAVDFLERNHLSIDHNAADGSGDENARIGLHGSNLYGGYNPVQSISAYFSDLENQTPYSTGHRDSMISQKTIEMGIASSHQASALFTSQFTDPKTLVNLNLVAYPAPGESPIELLGRSYSSINKPPIWSIHLGSYYEIGPIEGLTINVKDNAGKNVNFTRTISRDQTGAWFTVDSFNKVLTLNPYQLVDGDYKNALGKTYTITISGLKGFGTTLSYNTHICSIKDVINAIDNSPLPDGQIRVHRVYNNSTGEHLYSPSQEEINVLVNSGWKYEGTAWLAPTNGQPVYRLYNPNLKDHLYTTDENEVNTLVSKHGWEKDFNGQPIFYSGGDKPIYRLYNNQNGRHHLTLDSNEYNVLPSQGWIQEGVSLHSL